MLSPTLEKGASGLRHRQQAARAPAVEEDGAGRARPPHRPLRRPSVEDRAGPAFSPLSRRSCGSLSSSGSASSSSSPTRARATPSPSCGAGSDSASREAGGEGRVVLLRVAGFHRGRAPAQRVLCGVRAAARRKGAPTPACRRGVPVRPQGAAGTAGGGRGSTSRRGRFGLLQLDATSQLPQDRQQDLLGPRRVRSMTAPRVLLTGATGYVGGRLLAELERRRVPVRCLARRPEALRGRAAPCDRDCRRRRARCTAAVGRALEGIGAAYYLIQLDGGEDFAARDREAARIFGEAAREAGVRRIIYLGGLGESGGRPLGASAQPAGNGRDPAAVGRAGRRAARVDRAGLRQSVLSR